MLFVESTLKKNVEFDEIKSASVKKSLSSNTYAIGFISQTSERLFLAMKFVKESECDEFF